MAIRTIHAIGQHGTKGSSSSRYHSARWLCPFRVPTDESLALTRYSVMYSTSFTSGIYPLQEEFNVSSEPVVTLGVTTYLFGIAVGSLILAPISETYGRKPVYAITMVIFSLLVIPCAKATSLAQIIIFRFFGAVAGSSVIANSPGTVGDIVTDEYRALAFSIWSIGPLNGPGEISRTLLIINSYSRQLLGQSLADS